MQRGVALCIAGIGVDAVVEESFAELLTNIEWKARCCCSMKKRLPQVGSGIGRHVSQGCLEAGAELVVIRPRFADDDEGWMVVR